MRAADSRLAPARAALGLAAAALAFAVLPACRQEERRFRETPTRSGPDPLVQSELLPGLAAPPPDTPNPYEGNAHAIAEGKRLYAWFNCNGCHFNGGGGIGPALMDPKWIYGQSPARIFDSIAQGRPDGMPAFRQRLNDQQIWQLVSYIQTLGGTPPSGKPVDRPKLPAPPSDGAKPDDSASGG